MGPMITLEEHYVSTALQNSAYASMLGLEFFPESISRRLLDLSGERISEMNSAGIDVQVVSHNPGAGALPVEMCRQANDQLYKEGTTRNGSRLAGFAALPMNSPTKAAEELSRCVKDLKFVGALISNTADGHYFDDESYWPVFEKAQELDVPIYLHPTYPDQSKRATFQGNYGKLEENALSSYAWGWHSDVGFHFLRLFASGVFDKFPRLKLILGHMGEMLPFMIDRIERFVKMWDPRQRSLATVWAENVWITTSGMFTLAPLVCLLRTVSVDKIMFSIDYPFEDSMDGKKFMDEVQKSGLLSANDVDKIAHGNALRLLRISVGQTT